MQEAKILVDSARIVTIEEAKAYKLNGAKPELAIPKSRRIKKTDNNRAAASLPTTTANKSTQRLYIRLKDASNQAVLQQLKQLLDKHDGNYEAVLVLGPNKQIIKLPQKVSDQDELLSELYMLVGKEHIKFQ
jgi:hypothetical protein